MGDQWHGVDSGGLPTPVFNIVARVVNYLVSSVMTHDVSVDYRSGGMSDNSEISKERIDAAVELLNRSSSHRWEKLGMDSRIREGLLSAALTGDAVFYSWWDNTIKTGQLYRGDIALSLIDTRDLFVADPQCDDIQKQDYVIVRGCCPTERLRDEAKAWGLEGRELLSIVPDGDEKYEGERTYRDKNGRLKFRSGPEPKHDDQSPISPKCSYLVKFWRDEKGNVRWEKSTRTQVIRRGVTRMKLYPFAVMHWTPVRNCYHGASPVTQIIGNQKYINKAYAMAMKHMVDTAFSKVIYDRRLIPEWSNEVGQAIGVNAGGDVSNAVRTVGVGELTPNFTDILSQVISETKTLLGATETAIGESSLSNTSAIVALQEASEIPLDLVRHRLYRCVEDIANIWIDMIREFYHVGRLCDSLDEAYDTEALRAAMIHAHVDVGAASRYSQILRVSTLDRLLDKGHITFAQYLSRLPEGVISDRSGLLKEYSAGDDNSSGE
nr:hypothetical protein [Clostridia bacterium]